MQHTSISNEKSPRNDPDVKPGENTVEFRWKNTLSVLKYSEIRAIARTKIFYLWPDVCADLLFAKDFVKKVSVQDNRLLNMRNENC